MDVDEEGGLKITKFLRTSFMMAPYTLQCICSVLHDSKQYSIILQTTSQLHIPSMH